MLVNENREIDHPLLIGTLIAVTFFAYYLLGFDTSRSEFPLLIIGYVFAFSGYLILAFKSSVSFFNVILISAILSRLMFISFSPELSDDYFRFLWDGHLFANGINPFEFKPVDYIKQVGESDFLKSIYPSLNSKSYFSVYPAVLQYVFGAASYCFPSNIHLQVVFLKCVVILAEIGSIFLIIKILKQLHFSKQLVLIYALNPLVILELSGNLHFEVLMIFFVLLAIYLIMIKRRYASALALSFAFASKLLPLLFLPFIWKRLGVRKSLQYSSVFLIGSFLLFLPFWSTDLISNMTASLKLYVEHFEFNASIFYLIRAISPVWNDQIIFWVGRILSMSVIGYVVYRFFRQKDEKMHTIFYDLMWILVIYMLLSKVVHPWYITPILAFSIFTHYRFVILWTFLIFITYVTYSSIPYLENQLVVFVEYLLLGIFMYIEIKKTNAQKSTINMDKGTTSATLNR